MTKQTTEQSGAYTGDWYDERNKRRKEAYHSNPKLRSDLNASSRDGYRDRAGVKMPFDPRINIGKEAAFGTVRTVRGGPDDGKDMLTFTKAELGKMLGRPTKQVQQWAADGRIPQNNIKAKKEGVDHVPLDAYYEPEAVAILVSLGSHLANMLYFRTDHVDAIRAVHDAVDKARC